MRPWRARVLAGPTEPDIAKRLVPTALLVLVAVTVPPALAQSVAGFPSSEESESEPASDPTSPEAASRRLEDVRSEIQSVGVEIQRSAPARSAHLQVVRAELEEIAELLQEQITLTTRKGKAVFPDAPVAAPSPHALRELYEARFAVQEMVADREARVGEAREALAQAKEALDAAAKARREARAELEAASPGGKLALEQRLELREKKEQLAEETVYLRTLQTRAAVADRVDAAAVEELDARIEAMREALARGEGDSTEILARLAEREGALRREREAIDRRLASAEVRLGAAQNRLSREEEPASALLEEVEALSAQRDAVRQEAALADARLERLSAERELWRQWETLLRGSAPGAEDLAAWESSAAERLDVLRQAQVRDAGRLADLESRLDRLERRRNEEIQDSRLRVALEAQAEALRALGKALRLDSRSLAADRRLNERVLADIRARSGYADPVEYVARGAQTVGEVWTYEITTVDDAPITVGSLVLALVLFGMGLWAARRGSAVVARVSEERFRFDAGAAHALGTLSFYGLLVGFSLLALRAVHFPLTAFTVLGGALAIGIGFGSQNVMNNFISGLILMLERPVRARDVVEVDGNHGTIENIGARSTQIRSLDGRHMIVPNSFFLESNVVNWTLSDDLMRAKVSVGVIYGSPTRLVEKLIKQVVSEDEEILKRPDPTIIFEEFGDNSLNFDVYFWVKARSPMEMRKVQSRVRFRIDDLFRDNNLVIAFPQRDVHLDSAAPIEVRVLNGGGEKAPRADARPA